jgi:hypothetical protein
LGKGSHEGKRRLVEYAQGETRSADRGAAIAQCPFHWLAAEAGFALLAGEPPTLAAGPAADAASDDATASDAAAVPDPPESAAVCAAGGTDAPDTGAGVDNVPDAVLLVSCGAPSSAAVRCR